MNLCMYMHTSFHSIPRVSFANAQTIVDVTDNLCHYFSLRHLTSSVGLLPHVFFLMCVCVYVRCFFRMKMLLDEFYSQKPIVFICWLLFLFQQFFTLVFLSFFYAICQNGGHITWRTKKLIAKHNSSI